MAKKRKTIWQKMVDIPRASKRRFALSDLDSGDVRIIQNLLYGEFFERLGSPHPIAQESAPEMKALIRKIEKQTGIGVSGTMKRAMAARGRVNP